MQGKLYLLIWDKLVLGTMIALAFVCYDRWKSAEQRKYEDKVTLAFQRASYVKELVPIVVDSKTDVAVRGQALIALVETRSISDNSALALAERLLRDGLIRSDYPEMLRWNRDHPLLDALAGRMPSGLEPLLQHYMVSMAPDEKRRTQGREKADIEEFWSELFFRSIDHHKDSELPILDDDAFLDRYLGVMDHLVDLLPERQRLGREWFSRRPKALRVLAALRGIGDVGRYQHAAARKYLLELLTPKNPTEANLTLAADIVELQQKKLWASKALAAQCLGIVLREDADVRVNGWYQPRALSCGIYIEWYATTNRDDSNPNAEGDGANGWNEFEPMVVMGLRQYFGDLAREPLGDGDLESNKRNSIARPLIEIIVKAVERGERPSEPTRQLLSEVFAQDDRTLGKLILIDLRARWLNVMNQSQPPGKR
jgi:hypothetical protein